MTEMTPTPGDPSGPSAMSEQALSAGPNQLLDGASSGTDDGPGGIPAALAGVDKDGDPVPPPPAALPGDAGISTGDDPLSLADPASPQLNSAATADSAAGGSTPLASDGR